jgi:hypothetical protein
MQQLLDNLLISEVAEVSGAKLPSLKQWIDTGLITAPPVAGKHRRFSARNTIEVILMARLIELGIKASVAGQMAVKTAPHVLMHYTVDWAEQRGDEVVMTRPWVLVIGLNDTLCTWGVAEAFSHIPGDWLKIELAPVIGGALTRALAIANARAA